MFKKILFIVSISLFLTAGIWAQGTSSNGPSTSASKSKVFRPTKDQVKQGQTFLKGKNLYTGEATGVYNDPTRAAIKTYQKDSGLEVNGKFDQATLEKMSVSTEAKAAEPAAKTEKTTAGTTAASTGKRPAPFQATKDQIIALQKGLTDAKLYTGPADGARSDALKSSIEKYQQANALKVTGGINSATLEKMGIALTDKQKQQVAAQAAYDAGKEPKD